jgi:hypothetical protein
MNIGEHTPDLSPDNDRRRVSGVKPDWSRPSGAKTPAPAPYNSYAHENMDARRVPPEAFVRSLSEFLGCDMAPVQVQYGEIWRWNMHPGAGVLTLPFPRHWTFRRKGAGDDGHPLRNHVIVGSWKIAPGPLNWWIAAAEQTATNGLSRERLALRSRREDPSWVPRGFTIMVLPSRRNWMEPQETDVHLLLAGSPGAFPALNPRAS